MMVAMIEVTQRVQVAALLLRMYDVEGEGAGSVMVDGIDVKAIDAR